jgi:hypothetical protein
MYVCVCVTPHSSFATPSHSLHTHTHSFSFMQTVSVLGVFVASELGDLTDQVVIYASGTLPNDASADGTCVCVCVFVCVCVCVCVNQVVIYASGSA